MNRKKYIQELCNKYGDFKVAFSFKNKKGDIIWSKHKSVIECWESDTGLGFLDKVNHRQILPFEIVLDIDDNPSKKNLNLICDKLDSLLCKYIAFFTGSKGYHIHIKEKDLLFISPQQREKLRETMILYFKCDIAKKSEKSMIALENVPHWKTGKLKKRVRLSEQNHRIW